MEISTTMTSAGVRDAPTTVVTYMGLPLQHPFILGASPLTGHVDNARRLEDNGCAAIVMHSLFEEQIAEAEGDRIPGVDWSMPEFDFGFAPFLRPERFPLAPQEYLEQLRRIKSAVSIPVIGSLNGIGADGWLTYGPLIEQAGADAIELNVYYLATGLDDSAEAVERRIEALVRGLKALVRIPIAVKLSPFYTAFANVARRLEAAGADGLVLFNRFYQADIDIEELSLQPNLRLSTSADLVLRLHWLAILAHRIRCSLAATGGVHGVMDGVKALLSGAHAVQIVSAVLQHGPEHFTLMEHGLRYWMARHERDSIEAFRGLMSLHHGTDLGYFERANYVRVLHNWRG